MYQAAPIIAVVDDDESIRRSLNRLLRSAGLTVEMFATGEEFLKAADTHRLDCVILDLHMPELGGFDIQDRLVQANARIPVVILTGYDTPESRNRAQTAGVVAFLLKPVDGQVLIDAVKAAVADRFGKQ